MRTKVCIMPNLIISYDIKDDRIRSKFSKMLTKNGCIRLQYSVYEFNNTKRLIDKSRESIKHKFAKQFTEEDSVVIFDVNTDKTEKYGNAIHRDQDIVFF